VIRHAKRALAIVTLTTLIGCTADFTPASPAPSNVPTPLHIHSTDATAPLLTTLSRAYVEVAPNTTFNTARGDWQTLLTRVAGGQPRYFLSNHLPSAQDFWAAPLAQDGIALVVHPTNPVRDLTLQQVRRIYRGYITNWQEVGGADLNVHTLTYTERTDTRAEFERLVMGQEATTPNAVVVPSIAAMHAQVSQLSGAIGFVPLSQRSEMVASVQIDGISATTDTIAANIYSLRLTLYIIGPEEPQGAYLAFVNWVQGTNGLEALQGSYAPPP